MVLINKSTVPVGTARHLEGILKRHNVPNAGVASNPEFLPEGDAVEKLQYDLYYIKHLSPIFDLQIIFESLKVILLGSGAR